MKLLILFLIAFALIALIWARLYPNQKVTIQAKTINTFSDGLLKRIRVWSNNRIQTHRLRQSLVQREKLLADSQQLPFFSRNSKLHELVGNAFRKTIVFQWHHKTKIIIPTGTFTLSKFATEQLDNYLLELLVIYYPDRYWQQIEIKKIPLFNYFYLIIQEK